jgi:hypothetical protein
MEAVEAAGESPQRDLLETLLAFDNKLNLLKLELNVKKRKKSLKEILDRVIGCVQGFGTDIEALAADSAETLGRVVISLVDVIESIQRSEHKFSLKDATNVFKRLHELSNLIRWSGWEVNTPLMVWAREPKKVYLYPTEFNFRNEQNPVIVKLPEIETLIHSTNTASLLSILDLYGYDETQGHRFRLKVNRDSDKTVADVTTGGLLYCGFELPLEAKTVANRNQHAKENRYGSCVLKFPAKKLLKEDGSQKFWQMGSKFYVYEWSQIMLIDSKDRNEGDNWRIVSRNNPNEGGEYFSINSVDYVDMESFEWKLGYEVGGRHWTHPALVFCEDQFLDGMKGCLNVEFDHHKWCSDRRNCIECHISNGGAVAAQKVNVANVSEGNKVPVTFSRPLTGGKCGANKAIAIRMFALSVPIDQRDKLENMQGKMSIFTKPDYEKIANCWEKEGDHYYKDWTAT